MMSIPCTLTVDGCTPDSATCRVRVALSSDLGCLFVVPQCHKPGVSKVCRSSPLKELEFPDQYGFKPAAILHFLGGQALPPTPLADSFVENSADHSGMNPRFNGALCVNCESVLTPSAAPSSCLVIASGSLSSGHILLTESNITYSCSVKSLP